MFGFGAKDIAEVPVPGEGTVSLPAGKVRIRYVEDREGRAVSHDGGTKWAGPQDSLEVSIVPASGGEPVSIKKTRMIQESAGRGIIHKALGSFELPAGGEFSVTASMSSEKEHHNPRITFRA